VVNCETQSKNNYNVPRGTFLTAVLSGVYTAVLSHRFR